MTGLPDNPSESFKLRNPHLYPVRRLEAKVPQPDQGGERQNSKLEKGAARMAYRVSLVVLSRRNMDAHDNLPFSLKPLADAIAESLGRDDADIQWEYAQAKTYGRQGVIVKIEVAA